MSIVCVSGAVSERKTPNGQKNSKNKSMCINSRAGDPMTGPRGPNI